MKDAFNLFDLVRLRETETETEGERGLFERQNYSVYSGMAQEYYYSYSLGTIVNTKYVSNVNTQNEDLTPYTFTKINCDSYNYKPGDKSINNMLAEFNKEFSEYAFSHAQKAKIPDNFSKVIENYSKHSLLQPYNIIEEVETDKIKLFFSINYRSKVFSNYLPHAG